MLNLNNERRPALMMLMVTGAGVSPADQRWHFWPLLPLKGV